MAAYHIASTNSAHSDEERMLTTDSDSEVDIFTIELFAEGTGLLCFFGDGFGGGGGGVGSRGGGGETNSSACFLSFSSRTRSWTNRGRMKISCGFFSLNDSFVH